MIKSRLPILNTQLAHFEQVFSAVADRPPVGRKKSRLQTTSCARTGIKSRDRLGYQDSLEFLSCCGARSPGKKRLFFAFWSERRLDRAGLATDF